MTRQPSCGARKNLRAAAFPLFFRPLRQGLLAASATGGECRRYPAGGFGAAVGKRKIAPEPAVLRRLPPTKIVFDTALMLFIFQLRKRS